MTASTIRISMLTLFAIGSAQAEAAGLRADTTLYEDLARADLVATGAIVREEADGTFTRFDLEPHEVIVGTPPSDTISIRTRRRTVEHSGDLALIVTTPDEIGFAAGERVLVFLQKASSPSGSEETPGASPHYRAVRKIDLTEVEDPERFVADVEAMAEASNAAEPEQRARRLRELLASRYPELVESAVKELGRLESQEAVAAIAGLLRTGSHAVRFQAVDALRQIGGSEAAAAISTATRDASPRVRARAVRTLGWMGEHAAEDRLLELFRSPSEPDAVKINAVLALQDLGSTRARPIFEAALEKETMSAALRRAVRGALHRPQ